MKKLTALFCVCILMTFCVTTASAEAVEDELAVSMDEAIDYVNEIGIEVPFEAEPDYTSNITQTQFAVCIAQILSGKFGLEHWDETKASAFFSDVSEYGDAVDYVYAYGVLNEYEESIFGATSPVMYQDALAVCVRVLGYDTGDTSYPYGYILCADRLEIMSGIDIVIYKQELTVGEALHLIWNVLNTIVAATDPITEQIVYPDEKGLCETVYGYPLIRQTLLEKINGESVVLGDLNGDGVVNVQDVLIALKAILNGTLLDGADVNGDGSLSLIDVLHILKATIA